MDELTRKINMWRLALEERNADMGVMQVFDSMLVFMGEQQRENERLYEQTENLEKLKEVIARNLTAWDTSQDSKQGLLPEVYWSNRVWYKRLTGEDYSFSKAVKKFNIE